MERYYDIEATKNRQNDVNNDMEKFLPLGCGG